MMPLSDVLRETSSQLVERLAIALSELLVKEQIAERAVEDIVTHLGFDFATLSLVDTDQGIIRCLAAKNADWKDASRHALSSGDVQALVASTGQRILNDGSLQSYLDRTIWYKYGHRNTTRVWIPIPRPASFSSPYPALGTVKPVFSTTTAKIFLKNCSQFWCATLANSVSHSLRLYVMNVNLRLQKR